METKKLVELQELCRQCKLRVGGRKAELIERLNAYLSQPKILTPINNMKKIKFFSVHERKPIGKRGVA